MSAHKKKTAKKSSRRALRDTTTVDLMRDGVRLRAVTLPSRRRVESKRACRGRHTADD
jgi:hypothetical protein